jgi:protein-S-isoprenylcysteine O-methyltransferase Ste14
MTLNQIFLSALLLAYILVFLVTTINVKRQGVNARGVDDYYGIKAKIGSLSIFLWVIMVVSYVVSPGNIDYWIKFDLLDNMLSTMAGMILCIVGGAIGTLGMLTLGDNFRISFPEEGTQLVTHGIYGVMRNPIVFSIFLMMAGTFLLIPSLLSLFNLIVNIIGFDAKATDEERFLAKRFGNDWIEYTRKTGKYLPRVRISN